MHRRPQVIGHAVRSSARLAITFVAAAGGLLCPTPGRADAPLVFVGIPPLKSIVDSLAGDAIDVRVVLPTGASPATYEPTAHQLADLASAELLLVIGVPFEHSLAAKLARVAPSLRIVDLSKVVERVPIDGSAGHHHAGSLDPHIWLDPVRMLQITAETANQLARVVPDDAKQIDGRCQELLEDIERTHLAIATRLRPYAGRTVVVFHPAFGYFTRRYGLQQIAIERDGKAPTARQLTEIVRAFEGNRPNAIFVQPQFSSESISTVAAALEARVVVIDPLAEDYLRNLESIAAQIVDVLGQADD